jgi:serine O-acetyltransferase
MRGEKIIYVILNDDISVSVHKAFEKSPEFQMSLRQDILAVMDRDPAVRTSPDVLLYFKGFQALQTHRVAHWLWTTGRSTLALFLQSRANTGAQNNTHNAPIFIF